MRSRRRWQQLREANSKQIYEKLTRRICSALQELLNADFERHIGYLDNDDHKIWRDTKGFQRLHCNSLPIKMSNDEWAKSNQEKADTFATYLEEVFKPLL